MAYLVWDADTIESEGETILTNDPAVKRERPWNTVVQACLEFNEARGMEVVSMAIGLRVSWQPSSGSMTPQNCVQAPCDNYAV